MRGFAEVASILREPEGFLQRWECSRASWKKKGAIHNACKVFCVRSFPNSFLDHSSKERQELNPLQWSRYLWDELSSTWPHAGLPTVNDAESSNYVIQDGMEDVSSGVPWLQY